MMDLVKVLEKYKGNHLEYFTEIGIINALLFIREWDDMSIEDKLKKRIELFEYYEIYFNSTNKEIIVRNYERLIIKLSKLLIEFLGINLEKYSHEINRIRVMFYCELESLNKNYSYKLINHIPFSILEDLKDKIVDLYPPEQRHIS
ncbi:hypothetical protein ACKLNQ_15975 [Myroides odoratimimus]|uniref:hypothetical protein n=1 Tax=Myroides odoratimimus TaxID=76832 RepID=UPI0038D40ED0